MIVVYFWIAATAHDSGLSQIGQVSSKLQDCRCRRATLHDCSLWLNQRIRGCLIAVLACRVHDSDLYRGVTLRRALGCLEVYRRPDCSLSSWRWSARLETHILGKLGFQESRCFSKAWVFCKVQIVKCLGFRFRKVKCSIQALLPVKVFC